MRAELEFSIVVRTNYRQGRLVFNNLLCMINRHRPTRNKVRHRGSTYTSVCRYCHHEIERRRAKVWVRRKDLR
jgi:hypothetical protein